MAKRFTDTDIWMEDWFLDLDANQKMFWFYLKDNCDHAGIWRPNLKYFEFILGSTIALDDFIDRSNKDKERILVLPDGRWFLKGFIKFQYDPKGRGLNENSRMHKSIIEALEAAGIDPQSLDLKLTSTRPQVDLKNTLNKPQIEVKDRVKDKVKEKDKEIRKDRESERKETSDEVFDLDEIPESPAYIEPENFHDGTAQALFRQRYGRHTGDAVYTVLENLAGWPDWMSKRKILAFDQWIQNLHDTGKSLTYRQFDNELRKFRSWTDQQAEENCGHSLCYPQIYEKQKQPVNGQSGHQISDGFKARYGLQ